MTEHKKKIRFQELEKIQDLRTQEEIALKYDRKWTRKLPPRPVLPPYGKLIKIEGVLERFSCERYRENFGVECYRASTLPGISDIQRGAGAAAAIAIGSPAVGALLMTDDDNDLSRASYVQGVIEGKLFRGWVGMTRLRTGDRVEMVADWQEDHYEVYAITMPEERIISVCLRCDMGHIAHAWMRVRNAFILTAIIFGMFVVCSMIAADGTLIERLNENFFSHVYDKLWVMMIIGILVITGSMGWAAYKDYTRTTCKLAEEIFTVLSMKDVTRINLHKKTKKREAQLIKEGVFCMRDSNGQPNRPSSKHSFIFGGWYYY